MAKFELGPFTFILNDCLSNSYVQDLFYPDKDPYLTVEDYIRTKKQDDDLGLNDMKVENYEEN